MSEQKRSGCKGCLIWLLAAVALLILVIGVSAYLGYRKLVSLRENYTQAQPLALPVTSYSQAELDAMRKRIDQFVATARGNATNAELSLSANDLNALLATSGLSNRVYVSFTNRSLVGQISVPLEHVGIRFLKGRHLNGAGVFDVACANGELSVKVKDISVGGRPLPEYYMKGIRDVNYAQGLATNAATQEALRRIQRVAIDDDRLIFEVGSTNTAR